MLRQAEGSKSALMGVDLRDEEDPPSPERGPAGLRRAPLPQLAGDDVVRGPQELLCRFVVLNDEDDDRRLPEDFDPRLKIVASLGRGGSVFSGLYTNVFIQPGISSRHFDARSLGPPNGRTGPTRRMRRA